MVNAVTESYVDEDYGENEGWTGEEDRTAWTGAMLTRALFLTLIH